MNCVTVATEGRAYDIIIQSGLFSSIPDRLKAKYAGKKIALVCDTRVFPLYGEALLGKLNEAGFDVAPVVFEAGEESKILHTLTQIYYALAEGAFTRSDLVVALGGGVTGDMAGLAAATFLRGMGFIQIPTTLLAMVDSSVGGKVAVDLPQGKNLVGAFYQPHAVYTDPQLLKSLSDTQFFNGMAELIKHGFIRDKALYQSLSQVNPSNPRESLVDKLDDLIAQSCVIKRDVVEQDEKDNGLRQLLNFGHTIGHAIERVQNFSGMAHGEAVAIGMVLMTRLTEKLGLTLKGEAKKVEEQLKLFRLPVELPEISPHALIEAMKVDKKNRSGKITIAYIEEIGHGKLLEMELSKLEELLHGELTHSFQAP
ncbi:MAG: 3-dehydroquinate synthase [Clostridia bacterium]|nr:3-dehydroquinate synthase [Clostridia bacterium]